MQMRLLKTSAQRYLLTSINPLIRFIGPRAGKMRTLSPALGRQNQLTLKAPRSVDWRSQFISAANNLAWRSIFHRRLKSQREMLIDIHRKVFCNPSRIIEN